MSEHPIQGLMDTAMKNIKAMVDVNTIVGAPVTTPDGTVIIPISTFSFGFGAVGCESACANSAAIDKSGDPFFGGGSGGGASVKPVAFLVVGNGNVRLLPVTNSSTPVDKIIDLMPEMVGKVNDVVSSIKNKKKDTDTEE